MRILVKVNFKISRGSMPPDPSAVLAPSALQRILGGPTLNCFRRAWNVNKSKSKSKNKN